MRRIVLSKLLEGKSNPEIAVELGMNLQTVKQHMSHIMKKLGAHTREEVPGILLLPLNSPLRRR